MDMSSRSCHAVCAACGAKTGLLFERSVCCATVVGSCFTNNAADAMNHATHSMG